MHHQRIPCSGSFFCGLLVPVNDDGQGDADKSERLKGPWLVERVVKITLLQESIVCLGHQRHRGSFCWGGLLGGMFSYHDQIFAAKFTAGSHRLDVLVACVFEAGGMLPSYGPANLGEKTGREGF